MPGPIVRGSVGGAGGALGASGAGEVRRERRRCGEAPGITTVAGPENRCARTRALRTLRRAQARGSRGFWLLASGFWLLASRYPQSDVPPSAPLGRRAAHFMLDVVMLT